MTPRRAQILIGLGVLVAVLLVVLVVALIIGWEDPVAAPTSLPTTTSTAEPTTTSSSSSTTTSSTSTTTSSTTTTSTSTTTTTTTTVPPVACPGAGAGPVPAGSTVASEMMGDFDGDGADDRFLVYEHPGGFYAGRVELAYGYSTEVNVGPWEVTAISANLGGPAALVITESMYPGDRQRAHIYALDGCALESVEGPLHILEVITSGEERAGITCTDEGITVTHAEHLGGGDWEVSSITYFWDPAAGEFTSGMGAAAILHHPEDAVAIMSHGGLNC